MKLNKLFINELLALEVLQNQWVVGRVLTRHVGLKPDLRPNGLSGLKVPASEPFSSVATSGIGAGCLGIEQE
ncbi:MAG: hypothetical protein WC091_10575 [Sulfuricellaceae bacterium]